MSSHTTVEEKLEAMSKQMQEMSVAHQELRAQNEYLRKQLGNHMKQKQKFFEVGEQSGTKYRGEEEASNASSYSDDEIPFERRRRVVRPTFNSNDFKVEIPEFEGKLDPDEFHEWLQTVERIFEYKEIPDDRKVKLVALRLRKYASLWWTNLNAKRTRERKSKINTWDKMKSKMKARFLPSTYVQDNYMLFHHLTQGKMNVEEYTREFEKLMIKCDIHEPEEQTMVRYLGGLDPRIANIVELQAYTTFDEICVLAHKVELQRRSRFHTREEVPTSLPQEQPFNKGSPNLVPKPTAPPLPTPQKNQAPQRPQPNPYPTNQRRCYKCQGLGHLASDCPSRKVITLAEWEAVREEEKEKENQDEDLEEIEIKADEGELLLLEKISQDFNEEEHEQHTNIHICMLIIHNEQDPTPSIPIKPIPFTPIQDLSCSDPKLAHFAPLKQNPNPPPAHTSIISLHQDPKQFPMIDARETDSKFKPRLFEWLIIFQPSSFLNGFGQ